MLRIEKLTYRVAGRPLFEGASATVPTGHRIGLVGRNGSGKSTLLALVMGEREADGGEIALPRGTRIATVAQEAPAGPATLLDFVLAADRERADLLAEAETTTDPARIGEVHTRLADIGAHAAPARAAAILAGLGFDAPAQDRPLESFSGGWRMRVALAATLFVGPDLLLLDEPTNYLDLEGTMWLESHLRSYPRTLIVASHDRDLLNGVVTGILHIEGLGLTGYSGDYDSFERMRRERLVHRAAERKKQETQRRHMQAYVDRFRYKASKARQAQSRLKAIARLEPIAAVIDEPSTVFRLPEPKPLPPPLISLDGVSVGYEEGKPVLRGLDLRIDMDDRIALLGANGNGKSTFAKLLAGRLQPMSGRIIAPSKLAVGYFAQHQIDELRPGDTAFQHMARLMPGAPVARVRARIGSFGLVQDKADVAAGSLSGGEKARLVLALVSHAAPQLLVLDEPTNHLDIDARDALIRALNDYKGGIVLITHDRHLVDACADRLWLVAGGAVAPFDGDLADYRRLQLGGRGGPADDGRAADGGKPTKTERREQRRKSAEARKDRAPLRRAVRDAEKRMARLTREKAAIDAKLAEPGVYDGPKDALTALLKHQGETERAIATAEEAWIAAQEALEGEG